MWRNWEVIFRAGCDGWAFACGPGPCVSSGCCGVPGPAGHSARGPSFRPEGFVPASRIDSSRAGPVFVFSPSFPLFTPPYPTMVEGRPGFVKRACARQSPMACFARFLKRRRSSGVERALGKGEAEGSIPSGGTIFPPGEARFKNPNPPPSPASRKPPSIRGPAALPPQSGRRSFSW